MKNLHPIPSKVEELMTNPEAKLTDLSKYLNPGASGAAFHRYQMLFLSKIIESGIDTFVKLKEENEKVNSKTSNLSSQKRIIVQAQYKLFTDEYNGVTKYWNSLTDKQKSSVENDYYIEDTNPMKLNIIKINKDLSESGSSVVRRESLESDMKVIKDHYNNDINSCPDELKLALDDDLITFAKTYLSKLLAKNLTLTEEDSNIRITA